MRFPRLSANGWLLVIFCIIMATMVGEPAYRAITGQKSPLELQMEKQAQLEAKLAAGPQVGDPAPQFTLQSATDKRKVSLSDFKGRRVLITFFCGCSLCQATASQWAKLDPKRLKGDPQLIGICFFQPDRLPMFLKATGAKNMLYLYDPGHKVGIEYGSRVCPRTWLIDEHGKIAYRHEQEEASMPQNSITREVKERLESPNLQVAEVR